VPSNETSDTPRNTPELALVFGASGVLGSAIAARMSQFGIEVLRASRRGGSHTDLVIDGSDWVKELQQGSVTRVVWAQGRNAAGALGQQALQDMADLFQANVVFVAETLQELVSAQALHTSAGLVVISSVWQHLARSNKLAYTTSKASVGGLVRALAADLGPTGLRINAVLPGVVDSTMTRTFLSEDEMQMIADETPSGLLVTPDQVAEACLWLTSPQSAGVTGQSLTVDGGWSVYRGI
jgi:3-oxoacyl-[acyl-carrier protein] reductase